MKAKDKTSNAQHTIGYMRTKKIRPRIREATREKKVGRLSVPLQ
jgi:hypothetical protein